MKTFKTKLGTELPLLNLKGKDYLQVPHRVQWFREEHPEFTILTEVVERTPDHAVFRAFIKDGEKILAMAHKQEDKRGFPDFIEKAETGAIGRALALCGYGTQFASELLEGDRLADSPTTAKEPQPAPVKQTATPPTEAKSPNQSKFDALTKPPSAKIHMPTAPPDRPPVEDPGEFVVGFGKYKGKTLNQIGFDNVDSYVKFLKKSDKPSQQGNELISVAETFLKSFDSIANHISSSLPPGIDDTELPF